MSPSRVFPSSIPIRRSLGRKGIVTTVLDEKNYYVDFGRGEAELAVLLNEPSLHVNDVVRGWLSAEGDVWRIKQEGLPIFKIVTGHTVFVGAQGHQWHPGLRNDLRANDNSGGGVQEKHYPMPNYGIIHADVTLVTAPNLGFPYAVALGYPPPYHETEFLIYGASTPQNITTGPFGVGMNGFANALAPLSTTADGLSPGDGRYWWFLSQGLSPESPSAPTMWQMLWDNTGSWPSGQLHYHQDLEGILVPWASGPDPYYLRIWNIMTWHPQMTHWAYAWGNVYTWNGVVRGSYVGLPVGLAARHPWPSVMRWSEPSGGVAVISDSTQPAHLTRSLRQWVWTGAAWGAELAAPDRASGGPDVNSTMDVKWLTRGSNQYMVALGTTYDPVDPTFNQSENPPDSTLPTAGRQPYKGRVSVHPWSEVTGYGPKIAEVEWDWWQVTNTLGGIFAFLPTQLAVSPDGRYVAWVHSDAAAPTFAPANEFPFIDYRSYFLEVIEVGDDGLIANRWTTRIATPFDQVICPGVTWVPDTYYL